MPLTVLLVDDEPPAPEVLSAAFGDLAPQVRLQVATSVAECLPLLQREDASRKFALILLDLALPDGPGLEVLMDLRAAAATRNIPVVVLTRSMTDADLWTSYRCGANAYLVKASGDQRIEQLRRTAQFWCASNVRPGSLSSSASRLNA